MVSLKYSKVIFFVVLLFIYTGIFLHTLKQDASEIFKKELYTYDESANSVVSANIARKFFPAMLRLNPLSDKVYEKNWMYNAYWQHIPPLFAYAPGVFYKIDGQISIEVKRLSYDLINYLTGLIFILAIFFFEKKKIFTAAIATLAASLWITSFYLRSLVVGTNFGTSDLVLAFFTVLSFVAILFYLYRKREERIKNYWGLILIGFAISLPVVAKQALGFIPAGIFFLIYIYDLSRIYKKEKLNFKIVLPFLSFLFFLMVYYGFLYFSSPGTFKVEMLVSSSHINANFEGWGRPWHFFLTDYLPKYYLIQWYKILVPLIVLLILTYLKIARRVKLDLRLIYLLLGWFFWNLVAVSLVKSKSPNFMFQSFLFFIFVFYYAIYLLAEQIFGVFFKRIYEKILASSIYFIFSFVFLALIFSFSFVIVQSRDAFLTIKNMRNSYANYQTSHGDLYKFAEEARRKGWSTKDLVIMNTPSGKIIDSGEKRDFWFTYYILYLTGSESRTMEDFIQVKQSDSDSIFFDQLTKKYDRVFFLIGEENSDFIPLTNIASNVVRSETMSDTFIVEVEDIKGLRNIDFNK